MSSINGVPLVFEQRTFADDLGVPQHEVARWGEVAVQCRDHPVANFGFEVDDDVSAHDEVVRPAQDFVVAEVALRQKDARADALGNGVQLTVPNEVRIAPATGHPVDARFGIAAVRASSIAGCDRSMPVMRTEGIGWVRA